MLLDVIDGNGAHKTVCAQSQGTPTDRSGTVAAANVSQQLLGTNTLRSGWFVQNTTLNTIISVNEIGNPATSAGAVLLKYGDVFPPPGYPVTTGAVNIASGTAGATFTAREF